MENENTRIVIDEPIGHGVVLLTLNNPPLNLVTLELSAALYDTLSRLDRDESVRVVVLTGSGSRVFCAGSDIKEFPTVWDSVIDKKLKKENETFNTLEFLSKPVIAAMEGGAFGGGLEMAMACDLRVLSETGTIALPEVNLGVFPGSGGSFRLPKLVGRAKALEMMYLGEPIEASECLALGLVNRLAPAGTVVDSAIAIARKIAAKPVESIRMIKESVREMELKTTEECFYQNLRFSTAIFQTKDCAEGVDAFLNKRKPNFG